MNASNWSVRAKLGAAFGSLSLIVLAVCFFALRALDQTNTELIAFVDGVNQRALLANQVRTAVDRRAIAARNLVLVTTAADTDLEEKAVNAAHRDVQDRMRRLRQLTDDASVPAEAKRLVQSLANIEDRYQHVALNIVQQALSGKKTEAVQQMNAECRPLLAALTQAADAFEAYTLEQSMAVITEAEAHYARSRIALLAACVVAFAASVGAGLLISRSIYRSLGAEPGLLGDAALQVAEGNLSPLPLTKQVPSGSVMAHLHAMQGNLSSIVQQVRSASSYIASGSSQIAAGSSHLSERTEQQASALQETASTMDQLGATVRNNAEHASKANELGKSASALAVRGGETVQAVVQKMRAINETSGRISEIIAVIDSIAFQTNILALNAAVEAARAGEQGRGFAVVASEVRALATRSADAAKQVKTLIHASVEEAESGSALADHAGQAMQEVVSAIGRVSAIVTEISEASAEQHIGVDQMGQAIDQIDQATQQNAALVEESSAAADGLKNQAAALVSVVRSFRLPSSTGHTVW